MIEFLIVCGFLIVTVGGGTTACLIKWRIHKRKQSELLHQRIHDAVLRITADGKVEGPKGKWKPRRWGRKWLEYSNSIPTPRPGSKHFPQIREIPNYPHIGEE